MKNLYHVFSYDGNSLNLPYEEFVRVISYEFDEFFNFEHIKSQSIITKRMQNREGVKVPKWYWDISISKSEIFDWYENSDQYLETQWYVTKAYNNELQSVEDKKLEDDIYELLIQRYREK